MTRDTSACLIPNVWAVRPWLFLTVSLLAGLLSGCATIVNGSTQEITITSEPTGSHVDIDGDQKVVTPVTVKLARKKDHILSFQKEGYENETFTVRHGISGAVAGNILAGGFLGWGVDAASGAQYKLVPSMVSVTLRPALQTDSPAQIGPDSSLERLSHDLQNLQRMRDKGLISPEEYAFLRQQSMGSTAAGNQQEDEQHPSTMPSGDTPD